MVCLGDMQTQANETEKIELRRFYGAGDQNAAFRSEFCPGSRQRPTG